MEGSLIGYLAPVSRRWPQRPILGLCYGFSTTLCLFFNRSCPYQLISATCSVLSSSCLQLAHSFCFLLVSTSSLLCVCWLPLLSSFGSRQLCVSCWIEHDKAVMLNRAQKELQPGHVSTLLCQFSPASHPTPVMLGVAGGVGIWGCSGEKKQLSP